MMHGVASRQARAIALCVAAAVIAAAGSGAAVQPGLTAGADVARAYAGIMDARFDDTSSRLARTCPPAPAQVCPLLGVVARWWRIQMDPHDRTRDGAFEEEANRAISLMETWTREEPARAEAWFYLGGAMGARAQWRALRGDTLGAARDGTRIKSALERALDLDPTLDDAYFGIGLYRYYADVAPAVVRLLRWLLLMPGGSREEGLEAMQRARRGQILGSEADYQLHLVYLWYEKDVPRALALLESLRARHPHNPHFVQRIAEILDHHEDHAASLRTWQALLARAGAGDVALAEMTRVRARLGVALELDHLGQPDAAIPHLLSVIDAKPQAPTGAAAQAHLQLGHIYDRASRRDDAIASYRAALALNPQGDPLAIESKARAGLRSPQLDASTH